MGAFSIVINTILFLQCGLVFGSHFILANWNQYDRLQNNLQLHSSTATCSRKNTNITLTNYGGTTALATASINISHWQLGIHEIPECAFPIGCYDPHPIISLSTTTSTGTSLTPITSNRPSRLVLKPSISSLGIPTSPSNRTPSCLTN